MQNIQISKNTKELLLWGSLVFFLAIAAGAFGAHALKNNLSPKFFDIYQTAVNYHYLIASSFLLFGVLSSLLKINLKMSFYFLISAIVLFTGNLYLYILTSNKLFVMIVPLGGISFMISYLLLFFKIKKLIPSLKPNK